MTEGAATGRIVRVQPDVAALQRTFDYCVPASMGEQVRVGTQVRVHLQGRRVDGWVVEDGVVSEPEIVVRPIDAVRGWGPPPSVVDLAGWAAWRWAGPVSSFLGTASASRVVRSLPTRRPVGYPRPVTTRPGRLVPEQVPAEMFSGGTVVFRLAPASDPLPVLGAASSLMDGAGEGEGLLVLTPERGQASQVASRLRRSGARVAVLPEDWQVARTGGCIVVGTRSAALAPLERLVGAVVLDAHDESYHEERAPTWCAWEIVAERARRDNAPCVLVSACPTLDLLAAGPLVTTSRRTEREGWPAVEVVDRRADDPRTGLFSERLVALVRWAGEATGRRVLCILNRTGRVRLLACSSCSDLARCGTCHGALELVEDEAGRRLRCRRCGDERPVVCAFCGNTRMRGLRIGVTRAREELEALVGTAVSEVWGPPSRGVRRVTRGQHDDEMRTAVIVGTEALLHRVPDADAVAFLDFDAELLAPRMRASEEALALLARASRIVAVPDGRPGPESDRVPDTAPGTVLVQTRVPDHDVLGAAVAADPGRLSEAERSVREALRLPPFSALAQVSGAVADSYGAALREAAPQGVVVNGPVDGKWSIRAPSHTELCDLLDSVKRPSGRLRVEVDPVRI